MVSTRPLLWGLICSLSALPALAQSTEPPAPPAETTPAEEKGFERLIELHGFGNAYFGDTDGNHYLEANEDGNYQRANFAINLTAKPFERITIHAQTDVQTEDDGTEAELDFAFAEIRINDHLSLRAGKVKQPFGLYTEIFDVGTLRLFSDLPQVIYGPIGFVSEGFQGLSVSGRRSLGSAWSLDYDLYGGGLVGPVDEATAFAAGGGGALGEETADEGKLIREEAVRKLVGGRLVFSSALDTLHLGVSAHTGNEKADAEDTGRRRTVVGGHLDYTDEPWTVRAEVAHADESGELTVLSYYGEAAYRFARDWQLAARYEWSDTDFDTIESSSPLLEHKEWSVGVNRWVTPYLVFRLSFHDVEGNRLAHPEDFATLGEALEAGDLDSKTRLVQLSAHFSF